MGVHLNNLNGCTYERKFREKSVLFLLKTFFLFWSSSEFGEKSVLFLIKTFIFVFGLHLNLGKKSVPFAFFLVFTKFPHLNKIVVEVHPLQCWKLGKIGVKLQIIPPNAQQRSAPLSSLLLKMFESWRLFGFFLLLISLALSTTARTQQNCSPQYWCNKSWRIQVLDFVFKLLEG